MAEDINISSLVVQVHPESMAGIMNAIERLPGAEIHASSPLGKIVIVLDLNDDSALSDRIGQIQKMQGVLSASLVFHHVEDAFDSTTDASVEQA
ncbi:chaperone NapD [Pelagibius sp. Alg239-R121]|uniref:chaperone NapD n=1 Tax=Pelagibius sp. Alg239-R121 TaxID=2993448 RepID=UPI0024A623D9|nr:chaperone NapD [Pelagibius sp. Alg239-R121]